MKKYVTSILFLFLLAAGQLRADNFYPAFTIPEALKTNAYAVMRLHETTFTVKSPGEAVERVHFVMTVLNEKGDDQARLIVDYDKLSKVNEIEGALYDAFGKQVKRMKKADIQDVSAVSDGQLFMDNRLKVAKFTYAQYPYTVEFTYEKTSLNLLFYPVWTPQDDNEVSVEKATFTVNLPAGMELRYREEHLPKGVAVSNTPTGKQYVWQLSSLPTFEWEGYQTPTVYTTASDFEVEGHKGSLRTWTDIGKFFYDLNEGRDELPETVKQKVLQLVANEKTPAAKVKKLYEYMQANTRYVGVQLGIGGWQTIPAATVAEVGYGDCKALSNYMKAMLKAAGIPSYVAAIKAGPTAREVMADFPSPYFNHVILCVPMAKDTVWLECTSQTEAFGYQGSFTGNRYALLQTPEGGKLVRTTQYASKDNLQIRKAVVTLAETGDATAAVTTRYTGEQQDEVSAIATQLGAEDQKKQLYKRIDIPSFEINRFAFSEQKTRVPALTETLSLTVRKCGSKSGTRMFVNPNLMNVSHPVPPPAAPRKTEFVNRMAYQDVDTVVYQLPKGYGVEFLPDPVKIESKFGLYQAGVQAKEGEITYVRSITVNRGKYPAEAYNEWIEFRKKIAKADKAQMVLVNKGL
ncbi:MAG: DUF3857 and transglutaminase domain-containing protein [Cytophagales bacterium]|jgi:transglutaminase-like putative cysteine protease|nr:DUF3857 and transglutaminase domain-containing protein [Cytophagales bacterium]